LYASPNIIKVMKWRRMRLEGHVARVGKMWNAYKILVRKPEGKKQLGRRRRRCESNGKRWEDADWIYPVQVRDQWQAVVNTVMNLRVLQKAENFVTSWVTISFSRRILLHRVSYNILKPMATRNFFPGGKAAGAWSWPLTSM
jgi:hypothetical protein